MQLASYLIRSLQFDMEQESLSLNLNEQARIDSLLAAAKIAKETRRSSFNPNYISDFKGYELGMSLEELDRLHHFRASGKYVYSADQFQNITRVHDTVLEKLAPYFRFPKKPFRNKAGHNKSNSIQHSANSNTSRKDLNEASEEDLKRIFGIGDVLSARIIKFRNALGGFIIEDQLFDVYGLDSAVARRVITEYEVRERLETNLINLNKASEAELSQNIYISRALAREIIRLRDSLGSIDSLDELTKIQDFPADKIERIKLYLTL